KYGDEGKVMGLAPYGRPVYVDQMRRIVRAQRDGTFELDLDWFVHHAQGVAMTWESGTPELGPMFSPRFVDAFGPPRDARRNALVPPSDIANLGRSSNRASHPDATGYAPYYQDVAASLQAVLEEAEFNLLRMLHRQTGQTALCLAGGVALNS